MTNAAVKGLQDYGYFKIWIQIIMMVLFVIGFLGLVAYMIYSKVTMKTTTATVTKVTKLSDGTFNTQFIYTVNSKKYTSSLKLSTEKAIGQNFTIMYNPSKPQEVKEETSIMAILLVFAIIFFIAIIAGAMYMFRQNKGLQTVEGISGVANLVKGIF